MLDSKTRTTAFIGLGVMGYPMAGHIAEAGHAVTVFNRTASKAEAWSATHGQPTAATPALAASGAEIVALCVGNDDDVREVVYGEQGVLSAMTAGTVLIDHTTASSELALELYEACAARDIGFVDAPVSGGQAGAENGALTVMAGGDLETFETAKDLFRCYAKSAKHMGPAGSGQLTKMVNQICIAGLLQGLSEGLHFAQRAGLDTEAVIAAIRGGAAQSWQMENRHQTMAADSFEFGFAVDWMRKDLDITLRAAEQYGASLPVTALVDQFYADVQQMGGGRWDTSSLIRRLRVLNPVNTGD